MGADAQAERPEPREGQGRVTAESSTAPAVPKHLPALDGVRGLAVFIVIAHNAGWIAGTSSQFVVKLFTSISATGWVGVSLFFALSGYLITGILLDTRGAPHYFRTFYARRTLRIFPLYYAFVAGAVYVAAPLAWSPAWADAIRTNQWRYWLYVSNWRQGSDSAELGMTHLWSLAVEEQFYLLWPMLVYALGRRGLAGLAVVMILTGPVIRYALITSGPGPDAAYLFTVARWDALAVGALLAAMLRDASGMTTVIAIRAKLTGLFSLMLAAVYVSLRGFHSDDIVVSVLGQSLIVGLSFCLLSFAVQPDTGSAVHRLLNTRSLQTLGKYSYAMYIFHAPLHHYLKTPLGPWVTAADDSLRLLRVVAYVALIFVLSYLAARLSWRIIEQPFLRLKERWAPRADAVQ